MILALNGATIMSTPWREELSITERFGFTGTEARQNKVRDFLSGGTLAEARNMLDSTKLQRGPLNALLDVVYGRPSAEVDDECDWLCDVAKELGFPGVIATPGPRPPHARWSEVEAKAVEAYARLGKIGERHGVDIGVEFIGIPGAAMTTLEQAYDVMRAVGQDNVRLVVDLFSFFLGGSSLNALAQCDPADILVAHLADCPDPVLGPVGRFDRLLPGDGVAPLGQMLTALKKTGYSGLLSVEVFNQEIWARDQDEVSKVAYQRSVSLLRQAGAYVQ
jgi:2-keto-myo-inositol isomerase